MSVKQLSVFAENKSGSLCEVTSILSETKINIRAFSVADTDKYGVIRMIVDDPRKAAYALSEAGKIVNVTDVVGVQITDETGGLDILLKTLAANGINVEYLYAFVSTAANAADVVIRVSDNGATEKILTEAGYTLISDIDIGKK